MSVNQLTGTALTVRQLFNHKYRLEYYQREYTWKESNVDELLNDLISRFLSQYEETDDQKDVSNYESYFLGPIVTNPTNGYSALVDGQQRLTTLMLLLIHLNQLTKCIEGAQNLEPLVYSIRFGNKTFNIDVPEREEVMNAILRGESFDPEDASDSVRKIYERSKDIENVLSQFAEDLEIERLVLFVDWLLEKVVLVEIKTTDPEMALEIFETMNDRGMPLSSTDMLKKYLLTKIKDQQQIEATNELWRKRINSLTDLDNNADSAFIKVWLRSKYADSFRTRKGDGGDFDQIGKAFHKWVRANANKEPMRLRKARDYHRFVNTDFNKMSYRYMQLVQAARNYDADLESVFSNAAIGITLQYLPIMAAITPDDDEQIFRLKARLVAGYIDILVARRIVNHWSYYYNNIVSKIFNLTKEIRNFDDPESLRDLLLDKAPSLEPSSHMRKDFGLNQRNGIPIRCVLARMTAWIEQECGQENRFSEYVDRSRKDPYEIEHIWPNRYDRYKSEFGHKADFDIHRNKLGGLLLLPKSFNSSFGAKPYEDKFKHYYGQNLLAQSLHPRTYENNPGVYWLIEGTDLPFKREGYQDGFSREDLDERQELYRQIYKKVWDPNRLLAIKSDAKATA